MTVDTFFANFGHLADAPNGVRKLRELIVGLAEKGQLVETADTSATKLLGDVAEFVMGQAPPGNECNKSGKGTVFVKTGEFGPLFPEVREWTTKPLKMAQSGDVLICVVGATIGKINLGIDCAIGRSVAAIRPATSLETRYLYYSLMPFVLRLRSQSRGSAQGTITKKELGEVALRVPPLEEQKRIVTKVDQLMTLCDELEARQQKQQQGRARLNNAALDALLTAREPDEFADHWQRISTNFDLLYDHPETIGKLRAAILQLAVQGKLVSQDKSTLWREGVLGDVVDSSEAGWSPQCENRPCTGEEWGVLKVSAVSWDKFLPDENKTLPSHLEPRPRYAVSKGDFLISRANTTELVARSVVVNQDYPRLLMSDKIIRIRFSKDVEPNYLNLVNSSPFSREYYARVAGGTSSSMKNVTRKQILELPVTLPPLEEQKRIVAKVDQLMALCDELEVKLNQTQQRSEKLMEATVRQLLVA